VSGYGFDDASESDTKGLTVQFAPKAIVRIHKECPGDGIRGEGPEAGGRRECLDISIVGYRGPRGNVPGQFLGYFVKKVPSSAGAIMLHFSQSV